MTKEELKTILSSKSNLMAKKAIEVIKAARDPQELKDLVAKGCPDKYYERDPHHPRSRYRIHHVLDTCFESNFGIIEKKSDGKSATIKLGSVEHFEGRQEYFRILLKAGFQRGSNNLIGDLFEHILNCCFYKPHNDREKLRQEQAIEFAKILCQTKTININNYASRSYVWVSNPENLQILETLGADLSQSPLIDCALNYVGCSTNSGESPTGRIQVIQELLKRGAKPRINHNKTVSWQHIRKKLKDNNLFEAMVNFGIIDAQDNQDYLRWLEFEARHKEHQQLQAA